MATVFGTLVTYRDCKTNRVIEREFTGENHGKEAVEFCAKHVRGYTQEEYAKMTKENQAKLEQRKSYSGSATAEGTMLWQRITRLWDWHLLTPFAVER